MTAARAIWKRTVRSAPYSELLLLDRWRAEGVYDLSVLSPHEAWSVRPDRIARDDPWHHC